MKLSSLLTNLLRSLLAFFLSSLAFTLIVMPAGIVLESVFPGSLGSGNTPVIFSAQLLLLVIEFIGGAVASMVLCLSAPRALNLHAYIFGALLFSIQLYSLTYVTHSFPLWYSVTLVISIPIQVWIGLKISKYIRGSDQEPTASEQ